MSWNIDVAEAALLKLEQRLRQAEDLLKLIKGQIDAFGAREIAITDDPFAVADMLDEFDKLLGEYFDTHPGKADSLIQKL